MKLAYRDKKGRFIKDGQKLKFKLKDNAEKSGFKEFDGLVRFVSGMMGYYSPEEQRVVPFRELYQNHIIENAEIIN
ncbi:hypothetical protein AWE51_00075 [Aquimarina aggregata]|uniref:Uncharacterized protein n=1 Tax=Aquimarina aggregata TaxID=1642818 RepID=A0A163BXM4_9FLAO|nr:hypothetical protein [Aquimarina aggregata]KZS41877.1 hypothetical protein AWE51_00075 [Aquimarina aggregata]